MDSRTAINIVMAGTTNLFHELSDCVYGARLIYRVYTIFSSSVYM